MLKISKRHQPENELIEKMRRLVKKDKTVLEKFKEYNVPISDIDDIKIVFDNLDVSAKTKNCEIFLNKKLCKKVDFNGLVSYLIHELTHYLQQKTGNTQGSQAAEYMDKKTEMEAFEAQVDFKKREDGQNEAEKYVDDLLKYHKIKGPERKEKKKELLNKNK